MLHSNDIKIKKIMELDKYNVLVYFEKNREEIDLIAKQIKPPSTNIFKRILYSDLIHMLNSLKLIEVSYEKQNGIKNEFLPVNKFFRELLISFRIIDNKINTIFKKNNEIKTIYFEKYHKILLMMSNERNACNCLNHAIDPYYNIELHIAHREDSLNKYKIFLEFSVQVYNSLVDEHLPNFKLHTVGIDEMDLEQRIRVIHNTFDKSNKLFHYATELSYRIESGKTDLNTRNVLDISMKLMELNNMSIYVYKNPKSEINRYLNGICNYEYFARASITTIYQLLDKMGYFLNDKLKLNSEKTYFKSVMKIIEMRQIITPNYIHELNQLNNSFEYSELNKLRQNIVHLKLGIDFISDATKISSLCVRLYPILNKCINEILESEFIENRYLISDRAILECETKKRIYKL